MKRLLLALLLVLPAGCASAPAPPHGPLESRPGIVFLAHGIWPDGWWIPEAECAFHEAGIETAPVEYTTFVPGYLFGFGTDAPTERLLELVATLERRHARTGCKAPLRYHAIGFSGGTVVALKAALRGLRLETAHLAGSPLPAFSPLLADAVRARRIGAVWNYWSPFDGVVGWTWGMGQWGYHGAEDEERVAIENVLIPNWHLSPPFDRELCERIARGMRAAARDSPPHTCFRDASFRGWWDGARERLARGERADELPAEPRADLAEAREARVR